jgi:hypothetical protein
MAADPHACFLALQQAVEQRFHAAHAPFDLPITEWKGEDIVAFQAHLRQEVQGQVSEKWFYTHIKQTQPRLPRIDVLNLLATYVGARNWASFVAAQPLAEPRPPVQPVPASVRRMPWRMLWGSVGLLLLGSWLIMAQSADDHRFCFVAADGGLPLTADRLQVWLHRPGESPMQLPLAAGGCVEVASPGPEIRLVIRGPYLLADTVIRQTASALPEEQILIYTDDYARMIHYFSTNNLVDWQKRRQQLEAMFTDEARIIQLDQGRQYAIEMYNKAEFVSKLSLPIRSLGQIEVLETRYEGGQITYLRFYQRTP